MRTLEDVLQEYDVEVKAEGSIKRGFCPFHEDTGKPNFTVYPLGTWYCFACNIGGNAVKFISLIEHIPYSEAEARVKGENIDIADLKERLATDVEEIQTFNSELNIEVSQHCRKYLQIYPHQAQTVLQYLKHFDQALQQEITHDQMVKTLENLKQTFYIKE